MRIPADALLILGGMLIVPGLWMNAVDGTLLAAGLMVAVVGLVYRFVEDAVVSLWPQADRSPLWAIAQAVLWIGVCGWILWTL